MKVLVKEVDAKEEGLNIFLGKSVTLFCGIYIYTGKLIGVNETCVKLDDAKIVYETGQLTASGWKDAQNLPSPWYVQTQSVESFGPGK